MMKSVKQSLFFSCFALFAAIAIVSCESKSSSQPPATPAQPAPTPAQPAPTPAPPAEKPRIDLQASSISSPSRIGRNKQFQVHVSVLNRSSTTAKVGNIELRISVNSATHAMNVAAGQAVFRNLRGGQTQDVTIQATAPNIAGMGTLHAKVNAVLADDSNESNNSISRTLSID